MYSYLTNNKSNFKTILSKDNNIYNLKFSISDRELVKCFAEQNLQNKRSESKTSKSIRNRYKSENIFRNNSKSV